MPIANRLCGFCGTFVDMETKDSSDGKKQTTTCTKCNHKYEGWILDKKTIAPDYLYKEIK